MERHVKNHSQYLTGEAPEAGPNLSEHSHKATSRSKNLAAILKQVGLRPTRQRLALGRLLFGEGDRHVCAETLYDEAVAANMPVSLATVYNTLHQFTETGLLREVAVEGSRIYFDTNVNFHHHFYIEDDSMVIDIPTDVVKLGEIPPLPAGTEISRIDVTIRLKRTR